MQIGQDAATVMTDQQAACTAGMGGGGLAALGMRVGLWHRGLSLCLHCGGLQACSEASALGPAGGPQAHGGLQASATAWPRGRAMVGASVHLCLGSQASAVAWPAGSKGLLQLQPTSLGQSIQEPQMGVQGFPLWGDGSWGSCTVTSTGQAGGPTPSGPRLYKFRVPGH